MTKKDYIYAANVMALRRMTTPTDTWVEIVDMLCGLFATDNPRFDEAKFREACYK